MQKTLRFVVVQCQKHEEAVEIWNLAREFGYESASCSSPPYHCLYIGLGSNDDPKRLGYNSDPHPKCYSKEIISYEEALKYLKGETMKYAMLEITNSTVLEMLCKLASIRLGREVKLVTQCYPYQFYVVRYRHEGEHYDVCPSFHDNYTKVTLDKMVELLSAPRDKPLMVSGYEVKCDGDFIKIGCLTFTKERLKELKRRVDDPIVVNGKSVIRHDSRKSLSVGTDEITVDQLNELCKFVGI